MSECKGMLSGHFECNGFAAKLEGKHLNIKVAGRMIEVTYNSQIFTHDDVNRAVQCVIEVNNIVSKSSMMEL